MKLVLPQPACSPERTGSERQPVRSLRAETLLARHGELLAVLAAVGLGWIIRGTYLGVADFPLNDGGMFYVMTQELERSHYPLPAFTPYNLAHIPFAYPPLGFYLAALVSTFLHISLPTVLRILPVLVSLATIAAFYRLARTLLAANAGAIIAVFAFAVMPRSFVWMIMGGGLTRWFGFLFAFLATQRFYLLYRQRRHREAMLATIFSALTLLSHLEAAYFLGLSGALLFLFYGRNRRGLRDTVLVALGAAVLAAPWWATVIHQHGIGPFVNAAHTGGSIAGGIVALALLSFTSSEPFFPLLGALALFGALVCWCRHERFLVCWAAIILALDPRSGPNYLTAPLALLIGVAIGEVLLPALASPSERVQSWLTGDHTDERRVRLSLSGSRTAAACLGLALLYAVFSALATAPRTLGAFRKNDRQAMQWVNENTPPASRFLVITGHGGPAKEPRIGEDMTNGWETDRVSEWFPALAGRSSVATVQGSEWLPEMAEREDEYAGVQRCADEDVACVTAWQRKIGADFSYVYIVKEPPGAQAASQNEDDPAGFAGCCEQLRQSFREDRGYTTVYDGPAAMILARRTAASASP